MSAKNPAVYLQDIADEIEHLEKFIKPYADAEDFALKIESTYACSRSIQIMGDAAKMAPESIRKKYPRIPWREMSAMRDKIVHDYGNTEIGILWKTIKEDIPLAKPHVLDALKKEIAGRE